MSSGQGGEDHARLFVRALLARRDGSHAAIAAVD
jgi:hypothetical protein